jgi:hypothetical protein
MTFSDNVPAFFRKFSKLTDIALAHQRYFCSLTNITKLRSISAGKTLAVLITFCDYKNIFSMLRYKNLPFSLLVDLVSQDLSLLFVL